MANHPSQQQVLAVCQAIEALKGLTLTNALWNLTDDEASKVINALLTVGTLRGTGAKDLLVQAGWTAADGWAINLMKYPQHQVQPVYIDRPSLEDFVENFAKAWEAYLTDGVEETSKAEPAPTEVPAAKLVAAQDFDAALAEVMEFILARGRNFRDKVQGRLDEADLVKVFRDQLQEPTPAPAPVPEARQTLVYQRRLAAAWDDVRAAINATPLTCVDAAASVWVNRSVIEEIIGTLREEGYRASDAGPGEVDKRARLLTITW